MLHGTYSAGQHSRRSEVHPALIKIQNKQAAFDLPLSQDLIIQLALEAAVRGQTIPDLIGTIVRRVLEKDLVGEILRNGNSPSQV
jgi:hypothetical protein